ncbi:unnamed protein product, partial [Schistosoma turkestanicum]
ITPPTSINESVNPLSSSPDIIKQMKGTLKLRSNSQGSTTHRRRESNSNNSSPSKNQKRGSRDDTQKK